MKIWERPGIIAQVEGLDFTLNITETKENKPKKAERGPPACEADSR